MRCGATSICDGIFTVDIERYAPVRLLGRWDKEVLRFANGLVSDKLYRNNPGRLDVINWFGSY